MSTYNLCFEQKYEKYQSFLSENLHFLVAKFSVYLNRHVFVMTFMEIDIRVPFLPSKKGICQLQGKVCIHNTDKSFRGLSMSRKSVSRLTDRLDMTLPVLT